MAAADRAVAYFGLDKRRRTRRRSPQARSPAQLAIKFKDAVGVVCLQIAGAERSHEVGLLLQRKARVQQIDPFVGVQRCSHHPLI